MAAPQTVHRPATIFIDGVSGTTGLEIRQRLAAVSGITVESIPRDQRKDREARKAMMAEVDLAVLCLPDDAAREAAGLASELGEKAPRLLDASTAHRVADGWVYGFAELAPGQSSAIAGATRVANPGCYATGAIALLRPLVDAGVVPTDFPATINAVSGYSGGGKTMIESYEETKTAPPFELYGLGLQHKHIPEIMRHAKLTRRPIFVPSVGNFRQGMLVSVPLHLDTLPGQPSTSAIEDVLSRYYAASGHVSVATAEKRVELGERLAADSLQNTDNLQLIVYSDGTAPAQVVLVARLDNLGKGAAGAALQNIKLMLGLPSGNAGP